MPSECEHFIREKKGITPNTESCEECEKEHLPVVAISMCLTCGHVGCCDSSIGKHATKHFKETGHPVMKTIPGCSVEPGEYTIAPVDEKLKDRAAQTNPIN